MLVVAVGVLGSLGALAIGPFMLEKVYDAELSGVTLALLAAGSGCYMVALALSQAIIALKGHSLVARGWVCGAVALALGTWLEQRRRVPPRRDRRARVVDRRDGVLRRGAPLQARVGRPTPTRSR